MKKEYSSPKLMSLEINISKMLMTSPPTLKSEESNEQEWNLSKRRDALTEMLEESEELIDYE